MCSCAKEQNELSTNRNAVSARADDFVVEGDFTRTSIIQSGEDAPVFAWKAGDVIGVVPMDGRTVQSNYEIAQIESDSKVARFDGGVWALKEGREYAAYYPFDRIVADSRDSLEFSLLGQAQRENNSLEHIGSYDLMYAPAVVASSGVTAFNFRHLISLIRIQITVPQADEYIGVTLESTAAWFAGKAALSLADGNLTAVQSLKSCSIALDNIALSSGEVLSLWFATLPTAALRGRSLTVTLIGRNGSRTMDISGLKDFEAGKAYSYSCSAASQPDGIEAVDLGLSVKWATCNLGAQAPDEYGDYYAWGEQKPYYRSGSSPLIWEDGKSAGYAWGSYGWCGATSSSMTKYCMDAAYGAADGKTQLLPEDDAASAQLGGRWRMPTGEECQELLDKCKSEWTKLNGVNGINFTGPNGNSIFLPASGYRTGTGIYLAGLYGYYWSSSLAQAKSCNAFTLYFSQYLKFTNNNEINNRCYGQAIRPVCD